MPKRNARNSNAGFTLIEALLSIVILGGMAAGVSAIYMSGLDTVKAQGDAMLLDSLMRNRMEQLLSTPFVSLIDGSESVTAGDNAYTINWTVAPTDLNGDTVAEPDAVIIVLTVSETGDSLETIVVDPQDLLGLI